MFMHAYPSYDLEKIFRLTVRNYLALRSTIPQLRNRNLADMIRANAYANAKDVAKIVNSYDPPPKKRG